MDNSKRESNLATTTEKKENNLDASKNGDTATTDDFRRVQEESNRLDEQTITAFHRGDRKLDKVEQQVLGATYERFLSRSGGGGNQFWTNLTGIE